MERTKARILHVDDHQDTRLMMAALLQDCGYGVLTAGSVAEGLELAREINFDLYILDVRLPGLSGVEVCRELRQRGIEAPVLMLTARGLIEQRVEGLDAGADGGSVGTWTGPRTGSWLASPSGTGATWLDLECTLAQPAMQLALVIEAAPDHSLVPQLVPHLAYRSLQEMIELPIVQKHLGPLLERHRRSIEIMRERADYRDGVIYFDVSDLDLEGYNKFVPYYLHRDATYSVGVSASPARAKISVGTSPWKEASADVNLASLCEKYGGGGHARVAAISLGPGDLVRARQIAQEITTTLRSHSH